MNKDEKHSLQVCKFLSKCNIMVMVVSKSSSCFPSLSFKALDMKKQAW